MLTIKKNWQPYNTNTPIFSPNHTGGYAMGIVERKLDPKERVWSLWGGGDIELGKERMEKYHKSQIERLWEMYHHFKAVPYRKFKIVTGISKTKLERSLKVKNCRFSTLKRNKEILKCNNF